MLPLLSSLLSGIGSTAVKVATDFSETRKLKSEVKSQIKLVELTSKTEIARLEAEAKVKAAQAMMEASARGEQQNFDLDYLAMKNQEKSYKDEYLLFLFSAPLWMSFIEPLQPIVKRGFEVLDTLPDWYMFLLVGMTISIMGMRGLAKGWMDKFKISKGAK